MFIKHEGNEDLNYENRESVDWPKREISSTAAENVGTNVLFVQKSSIDYDKQESNRSMKSNFESEKNVKNWFKDENYQIYQMNSHHPYDLDKSHFPYDVQVSSANAALDNNVPHNIYQRPDFDYPITYSMDMFSNERMNNCFRENNQSNMWNNGYFSEEVYRSNKIKPVTVDDPMAPLSPIVRQRGRPRGSSGTLVDEEGKAICLSGDKNEQRRQRNRLAAIQSRTRRKLYIQKLEERQHEQSFIISRLQNEIQYLRLMAGIPLDLPIQNVMDFTNILQQNSPSNPTITEEKDHINPVEHRSSDHIINDTPKD